MAIDKLVVGTSELDPSASNGTDIGAAVNGLIDRVDSSLTDAEFLASVQKSHDTSSTSSAIDASVAFTESDTVIDVVTDFPASPVTGTLYIKVVV